MEEPKTLSYDWQYGREELFLRVDSYMSDDNLYIGLYHMEDGYPESFADLTVNLPFAPLGGINEAYIDHNFSKEKLRFIKQHKLDTAGYRILRLLHLPEGCIRPEKTGRA